MQLLTFKDFRSAERSAKLSIDVELVREEVTPVSGLKKNFSTKTYLYQKQQQLRNMASAATFPSAVQPVHTVVSRGKTRAEVSLKKLFREWREEELVSCSHSLAHDATLTPQWGGKQELVIPLYWTSRYD